MPARARERERAFVITLTLPTTATVADARSYILRAVRAECGHLRPEDPMADFDRPSVEVRQLRNTKRRRTL